MKTFVLTLVFAATTGYLSLVEGSLSGTSTLNNVTIMDSEQNARRSDRIAALNNISENRDRHSSPATKKESRGSRPDHKLVAIDTNSSPMTKSNTRYSRKI